MSHLFILREAFQVAPDEMLLTECREQMDSLHRWFKLGGFFMSRIASGNIDYTLLFASMTVAYERLVMYQNSRTVLERKSMKTERKLSMKSNCILGCFQMANCMEDFKALHGKYDPFSDVASLLTLKHILRSITSLFCTV